jgi:predicted dehydrogenase
VKKFDSRKRSAHEFPLREGNSVSVIQVSIMTKLTTAFLGVAHIHAPDFVRRINARSGDITVKAVYDHDKIRGEARTAELPGSVFVADPLTIIDDPSIDSVIICTETNLHKDLVIKSAKAGKNIFCEKPIGISASDAKAMADAVRAAGVVFQTGFMQRGGSGNQFIRREVMAGNLGKITRARYSNCHQAALDGWFDTDWRWMADKNAAGGGAFLDMGAHVLDLVIYTLVPSEGEIVRVAASLGNRGGRYGTEIDEYGTGLLTFKSGASVVIEASWVDPALRSATEVFGTEGQIQIKDGEVYYYSKKVEGADGKTPVKDLPAAAPHAFELFWEKLLGNELPVGLVSIDEAELGAVTMEKLYKSAS